MVMQDGRWGYIDRTGKLVVPCKYMTADPFSEDFAAVQAYDEEHVMWGFIDKTGKEALGIVGGVGDNKFDPTGNARIEEALVIALRMFQNLK